MSLASTPPASHTSESSDSKTTHANIKPSAASAATTRQPLAQGDVASLDQAIGTLAKHAEAWLDVPLARKIEYARAVIEGTKRVAAAQVKAALEAKGLQPDSPAAGEDWIGGPYIQIRTLRLLIESMEQLQKSGGVRVSKSDLSKTVSGQLAVSVFPSNLVDRLLYAGFSAQVWMEPEVTATNLRDHMGGALAQRPEEGKVALVLGAGNVASIGPLDVVHKLFFEGQVAMLKFNPVNQYLGPFVEEAFSDLIQDGFLRTCYGGAEVGAYLCEHPQIDEIHITGSENTHDLIVFGPGKEGQRRKAQAEPVLKKPITSELGNVSPMIVVPGEWSQRDLAFQAENVATQMTQNGGFNCNATKVLVTSKDWPQRRAFLDRLREVLRGLEPRPAYYPGANDRFVHFTEVYPEAQPQGEAETGRVPPTLIPNLAPDDPRRLAFEQESFCAVTAEVPLSASSVEDFLRQAVDLCNHNLRGTLNAGLIIHPETETHHKEAFEQAIAELRYGSIGVNHWPALSFAFGSTTWGAFPGHTLEDVQSGIGTVHNARLFERPQKSVVRGPFRVFPKPAWFVTHRNAHRIGPKLVELEANPSLFGIPGVALRAALS